MYQVFITRSAERQLKKLAADAQRKIAALIVSLGIEPRPFGAKKLSGSTSNYRIRAGDYRIIYEIVDREITVLVLKIGHRKDVYR